MVPRKKDASRFRNFVVRKNSIRWFNLCQAHLLDTDRKPKRRRNLSARFLNVGQQRTWLCDEHFRMHQAGNMAVVETGDRQVVLVDCRAKGKSGESRIRNWGSFLRNTKIQFGFVLVKPQ